MRQFIILTTAALALIALNTSAQIVAPWANNLIWQLQQEPVDSDAAHVALTDLRFSLADGEPCEPDIGYSDEVLSLTYDLCSVLDVPEGDPIDGALMFATLEALANEVEVFQFPGEHLR